MAVQETPNNFHARLDALERDHRRLLRQNHYLKAISACCLLLGAGLFLAGAEPETQKVVKAQKFILVNDAGKKLAEFEPVNGLPVLALGDKTNNKRLLVRVDEDGPSIAMADPKGVPTVVLRTTKDGSALLLATPNGKGQSILQSMTEESDLTLKDKAGKQRVVIAATPDESFSNLLDSQENVRASLSYQVKTEASGVVLTNKQKEKQVILYSTPQLNALDLHTQKGQLRARLGLLQDKGVRLQLVDKAGKPVFEKVE